MSNLSFVTHLGDGTSKSFTITAAGEALGYFRAEDIHGYVDGVEVATAIEPSSPHLLIFAEAPPAGSEVMIRRIMPVEKPYADFERGNNFGTRQINNTFLQQLYLTQEILDGFYPDGYYIKQDVNLGGHRITNAGKEQDSNDYVIKETTDGLDDRLNDLEQSVTQGGLTYRRVTFTAEQGQTEFYPNATFLGILGLYINGVHQIAGEAYEPIGSTGIRTPPLDEGDRVVAVIGQEPKFLEPEQVDLRYTRYPAYAVGGETEFQVPIEFTQVMSVYINGVHQTMGKAWEADSLSNTVTFAEPLEGGDEIVFVIGNDPEESGAYVTEAYIKSEDTKAQEEMLPLGSKVYPPSGLLENGKIVTAETTHLRVLVSGKPTLVEMSPISTGVVSSITETGAIVGGIPVVFLPKHQNMEIIAAGATLARLLSEQLSDIKSVANYLNDGVDIGTAISLAAQGGGVVLIPPTEFLQSVQALLPDNTTLIFSNGAKLIKDESLINTPLVRTGDNCTIYYPVIDGNYRNFSNQDSNDITLGSTIVPGEYCKVIGGELIDAESSHVAGFNSRNLKVIDVDMGDYQDHFVYTSGQCWNVSVVGGSHVSASGREAYKFRGSVGNITIEKQSNTECVNSILAIELENVGSVSGNGFGRFIHRDVPSCKGKYYSLSTMKTGLNPFEEMVFDNVDFVSTLTAKADMREPFRKTLSEQYPFKRLTLNGGRMKNVLPQAFFFNYTTNYKSVYTVNGTVFDVDIALTSYTITYGDSGAVTTDIDIFYNAKESSRFKHERRLQNIDTFESRHGAQAGNTWLYDFRGDVDQATITNVNIRATLARNLINRASLVGTVGSLTILGNNIKCSPSFKLIDGSAGTIRNIVGDVNYNNLDIGTTVLRRGTTAQRPVFNNSVRDGFDYFDETLGIPIKRQGDGWIDYAGNVV